MYRKFMVDIHFIMSFVPVDHAFGFGTVEGDTVVYEKVPP